MSHHEQDTYAIVAAASGALCWSLDGLLLRIVEATAWQSLFWRSSSFALVLVCVLVWRERAGTLSAFRAMGMTGLLIGLVLAGVGIFFLFSITLTAVANTLVLFATVPIFAALLGWVFLRETVRLRTAVAIAVGLAGIAAILAENLRTGFIVGDAFAVVAAILFAANLTIVRARPDVSLLPPLIFAGGLASVIAFLFSEPLNLSGRDVALLTGSGAIQQTAAFLLFQWGARFLPPAEIGLLAYVETVFGPIWVWLAIGEAPSMLVLITGSVIIVTVAAHAYLSLTDENQSVKPRAISGN